tara:strand:+ start:2590 stop:4410 length:1821 start_codon:yes stop_codon:yes gene_type:complete
MKEENGIIIMTFLLLGMIIMNPNKKFLDNPPLNESNKANMFFENIFQDKVNRSPEFKMSLGIKEDQGSWDDNSERSSKISLERTKSELRWLKKNIDYQQLDEQTKLSFDLFVYEAERTISNYKYRYHNYPFNQMFGLQSDIPADLINMHNVDNAQDANNYISRLSKIPILFKHAIVGLEKRRNMGIIPPEFVFPHIIRDCKNMITNEPFENSRINSTLLDDFSKKVYALDIKKNEKERLIAKARETLIQYVKPAYQSIITYFEELEQEASTTDGVWAFPDGNNFYNSELASITTTNMTAEEIHNVGLQEVSRIHSEMKLIMKKIRFKGNLQDFFQYVNNDEKLFYEDSNLGRTEYVADAKEIVDNMKKSLDLLFNTKPNAKIIVKPVEKFREQSAGKAFYRSPAIDGSRPGIYYVNTFDMKAIPKYQMEALAYHEGIPGHHMQIAISQELKGLPMFRKFGWYTAYGEGWALYSEYLPKEIGFYKDPYSDFGRLAMELWRACRLVVDTGIHKMKWTREEGIAYYSENTPNAESDVIKMVERHIIMAGQATGYKIGMIKILELREKARFELGDKFDIREYHDVVLTNGRLPLNILEKQVDKWISLKLN